MTVKKASRQANAVTATPRGFTLMELIVVMGIIVTIVAISIPAVNTLTKGNNQRQAVNMVTAYIANARSLAMSSGKRAGVVFYEQTTAGTLKPNSNQTAIDFFVESPDQTGAAANNTIYVQAFGTQTQYLPAGVRVATLNDTTGTSLVENTTATAQCRAILFNSQGQLILGFGLAANTGTAPTSTVDQPQNDWKFIQPTQTYAYTTVNGQQVLTTPVPGAASPAVMVFDGRAFNDQNFPATPAGDTSRAQWLQSNADILVINAYTGNIIR